MSSRLEVVLGDDRSGQQSDSACPTVQCDGLPFPEVAEFSAVAARLVEEILPTVFSGDEPKSFIAHKAFDPAIHYGHFRFLCCTKRS